MSYLLIIISIITNLFLLPDRSPFIRTLSNDNIYYWAAGNIWSIDPVSLEKIAVITYPAPANGMIWNLALDAPRQIFYIVENGNLDPYSIPLAIVQLDLKNHTRKTIWRADTEANEQPMTPILLSPDGQNILIPEVVQLDRFTAYKIYCILNIESGICSELNMTGSQVNWLDAENIIYLNGDQVFTYNIISAEEHEVNLEGRSISNISISQREGLLLAYTPMTPGQDDSFPFILYNFHVKKFSKLRYEPQGVLINNLNISPDGKYFYYRITGNIPVIVEIDTQKDLLLTTDIFRMAWSSGSHLVAIINGDPLTAVILIDMAQPQTSYTLGSYDDSIPNRVSLVTSYTLK